MVLSRRRDGIVEVEREVYCEDWERAIRRGEPRSTLRPHRRFQRGWDVWRGQDFTEDEIEFMLALDRYKREARRPCPTWAEVLAVAKALGWRKG